MRALSEGGAREVGQIARRHGFTAAAGLAMLEAVLGGAGGMAQFSHPEFSGAGQWMRGGATLIGSMADAGLRARVAALCEDLAELLEREPGLFQAASEAPAPRQRYARSGDWWPAGMGHPNSVGSQDGMRYAFFARPRRLAIERHGVLTVFDTLDHLIGGVSQAQGPAGSLRFSSQKGDVDIETLPVVSRGV